MTDFDWGQTTWEGHRRRQHREYLALSFREKIENLERMAEVAAAFGAEKAGAPDVSDPTAVDQPTAEDEGDDPTPSRRNPMDVRHEPESRRFAVSTEHGEATLTYSPVGDDTLDFRSTFVPEEDRKGGIGEKLVLHALAWARDHGKGVIPTCPFVSRVVRDHPEHQPTIAAGR